MQELDREALVNKIGFLALWPRSALEAVLEAAFWSVSACLDVAGAAVAADW